MATDVLSPLHGGVDGRRIVPDRRIAELNAHPVRKGISWGIIAGSVANFGVQYNFTNTATALLFLSEAHGGEGKWFSTGLWSGQASAIIKSAAFVGSIIGMCSLGYLGDVIGRDPAFAVTSAIMVVGAIASAVLPCGSPDAAMSVFLVCRFFLGIGIGGCYPLASSKGAEECGSEHALEKNQTVGVIFFWQAVGDLAPYIVGMALVPIGWAAVQFRLTLALGFVPPLVVLALTYGTGGGEPAAPDAPAKASARGGAAPPLGRATGLSNRSFVQQIRSGMAEPGAWDKLAATSLCWFIYDIACEHHEPVSGARFYRSSRLTVAPQKMQLVFLLSLFS